MSDQQQPSSNTPLEPPSSSRRKIYKPRFHLLATKDYLCELEKSTACAGTEEILNPKLGIIKDPPVNKVVKQGTSSDLSYQAKLHHSISPLDRKVVRKSVCATNKNKRSISRLSDTRKSISIPVYVDPDMLIKYGFDAAGNSLDLFNIKSRSVLPQFSHSSSVSVNATEAIKRRHSQSPSNLMEINRPTYSITTTQSEEFKSSQHRILAKPRQNKQTDNKTLLIDIPVFSTSLNIISTSAALEVSNFDVANSLRSQSAPVNLSKEVPRLEEAVSTSGHLEPYLSPHVSHVITPSKIHVPVITENIAATRKINPSMGNECTIRTRSTPSASTAINTSSNSQSIMPSHTKINEFLIGTSMIDFWSPYPRMCTKSGSLVAKTQPPSDMEISNTLSTPPSPEDSLPTNRKEKTSCITPSVEICEVSSPSLNFEHTATTTMTDSTVSNIEAGILLKPSGPRIKSPFISEVSVMQVSASRSSSPVISQEPLRVLESLDFQQNNSRTMPQCTSSASPETPTRYESPGVKQHPCYLCYLPSTSQSPSAPLQSTSQVSITTQPSSSPVVEEPVRSSSQSDSHNLSIEAQVSPSPEDCVAFEELQPSPASRSTLKETESEIESQRSEQAVVVPEVMKFSTPKTKVLVSVPTIGSAATYWTPPSYVTAELMDSTDILDLSSKSSSNSDTVPVVFDLSGGQESPVLQNIPPPVTHSLETMYTRRDTPLPASIKTTIQLPVSIVPSTSTLLITTKPNLTTNSHLRLPVVLPSAPLTTVAPSKRHKRSKSSPEFTSKKDTPTKFEFVPPAISEPQNTSPASTSSASTSSIKYSGAMKKARLEAPHQGKSLPLKILSEKKLIPQTRSSQASERPIKVRTSAPTEKQYGVQFSSSIVTVPQTCSCNVTPVTQPVFDRSRSTAEISSLSNDCNVTSSGSLTPIVSFTLWQQSTSSTTAAMTRAHLPTTEAPLRSSAAATVESRKKKTTTTPAPESLLIELSEPKTEPEAMAETSISEPVPTNERDYWARMLPQLISHTPTCAPEVPAASAVPENSIPPVTPPGTRRPPEAANITLQGMLEKLYWLLIRQEANMLLQEEMQEEHERICMLHRRFYRKVWRRLQDQVDLLRVLQARLREDEP